MRKLFTFFLLLTVVSLFGQQYHESDKEGLRRFLRQGRNIYGARLTPADTVNWYTSEAWVAKIKSNEISSNNACTWSYLEHYGEYGNRIVKLDFGGYQALDYNFTGSFDGIYFPCLESLSLSGHYITDVDVEFNYSLYYLDLSFMDTSEKLSLSLSRIGVESRNESITELYLSNTPMRYGGLNLDLFHSLRVLECQNSGLSSLSFVANYNLQVVKCYGNNFNSFNVGTDAFLYLKTFQCSGGTVSNEAMQRLLYQASNLEEFSCFKYGFEKLDFTRNPKLKILNINDNNLKSLNLNLNPDLVELNCANNQLSFLDLNNQPKLESLTCSSNKISNLNVQGKSFLKKLYCGGNNLSSLNLDGLVALTELGCSSNNISSLYLNDLKLLRTFNCSGNRLSDLNLSNNTKLASLSCSNNNIQYLDCSNQPILNSLSCNNNNIEHLLISDQAKITTYDLSNNYLKFSTLPLLTEGRLKKVSPQKDFEVYCYVYPGSNFGHVYDLMSEYYVNNKYSNYSWHDINGNLIYDIEDGAGEGMFSIPAGHAGETIIFKITNSSVPGLTLKYNVHVVAAARRNALSVDNDDMLESVVLDVNIYPNPVTDQLNIETNSQISKMYVFDAAGRVLLASDATSTLNVAGLASGLHLLKIVFDNGQEKIIKFNKR